MPRTVATAVVHAAGSGPLGAGLSVGEGREGWAGAGAHGGAGCAVSALRVPAHPHLPGARGSRHELGTGLAAVAGARLQVPRRRPRKRIASGRPRPLAPSGANQVWSYDFVFDWCANGQQLKCLTVTDEWTKEGLAIEVDGRLRSAVSSKCCRGWSASAARRATASDNGPEFVARALLKWIVDQGIETALIDPGKPGRTASARASTASSVTSA